MTKKAARILAKHKLNEVDSINYHIKSNIIIQKLQTHPKFKQAKVIGIYSPLKNEVDLTNLNLKDKMILYPKINNKDQTLNFILVNTKTKWEINSFGIKEPKEGIILNDKIDLLIIPTLAKNKFNYRLGYGKGYYDKFIKTHYPLYKIGVVFDNLEIDFVEDLWDQKLDEFISN